MQVMMGQIAVPPITLFLYTECSIQTSPMNWGCFFMGTDNPIQKRVGILIYRERVPRARYIKRKSTF